jgi:hypothetical protein
MGFFDFDGFLEAACLDRLRAVITMFRFNAVVMPDKCFQH